MSVAVHGAALPAGKQCLLYVDVEGGDHSEHQNSRENIKTPCSSMQQSYYYFFFLAGSRVAFILADSGIRLKIGCYLTESNHDVHQQTASEWQQQRQEGTGAVKIQGGGWGGSLLPRKRPLLKFKTLEMSCHTGWVVKGMKPGRILEGHLTALHLQCKCWLRSPSVRKMSLHGLPAHKVIYPWTPIY